MDEFVLGCVLPSLADYMIELVGVITYDLTRVQIWLDEADANLTNTKSSIGVLQNDLYL